MTRDEKRREIMNNYRLWESTAPVAFTPTAIVVKARSKAAAERKGRKLHNGSFIMVLDWEEEKAKIWERDVIQKSQQPTTEVVGCQPQMIMKLKRGDKIRVHGWVTLSGVDAGDYQVKRIYKRAGRSAYVLGRINQDGRLGKTEVAHFSDSVDAWLNSLNDNRIQVISPEVTENG